MEDKKTLKIVGLIALAVGCIVAIAATLDHFLNKDEEEAEE